MKINFYRSKKTIYTLIAISLLIFNFKNISRIKSEIKIVKNNNFPFFYAPVQKQKIVNLNNIVNVYVPIDGDGCYVTKTPCVASAEHIGAKNLFGFTIFYNKN